VRVVGLDACLGGWLRVVLEDGRFHEGALFTNTKEVLDACGDASVVAIDIPIGVPTREARAADVAARRFVGRMRSSVFPTPPRLLLDQPSYEDALRVAAEAGIPGLSKQSWGLRERIVEVEQLVLRHEDIIEVHPEVSFAAMNGGPLTYGKRSWNGANERSGLLTDEGIEAPSRLEAIRSAPGDDVLDAAAASWSAHRRALGLARTLPEEPPMHGGRPVAIWY
jgi:predicted RNase H-like nuclease